MPEVLIQACGLRVVVAGAEVAVATQPAALLADHERGLAVRLQPDEAVDDVAAGALQRARPLDVGALVEAGLDLDEDHDLLAGLGGVDERLDDRRVTGSAVERLLDGEHVRVSRGLLDEPLHAGRERVVGVVHEDVALAQHLEEVGRRLAVRARQPGVGDGHPGRVLELRPVDVLQRPEGREVQQATGTS